MMCVCACACVSVCVCACVNKEEYDWVHMDGSEGPVAQWSICTHYVIYTVYLYTVYTADINSTSTKLNVHQAYPE